MVRYSSWCLICGAALMLAGCGGDLGVALDGGDGSGAFAGAEGAVPQASSPYMVVDLATGEVAPQATVSDIDHARYRTTHMVFRRVTGSGQPDFLIAVFEVTQAQWQALGGATPWTAVDTTVVGPDAVAADKPAFGLSFDAIDATVNDWNSTAATAITLPSAAQWQAACGGSGSWSWGDATDRVLVRDRAVVWETTDGIRGPRAVGTRLGNGYDLVDMHGNVWEWCSDEQVRGGSWNDPLALATTANAAGFDDAGVTSLTDHALFGVRLVLLP